MSWFYPIGNKRKHIAQDHDGTIYTKLTGSMVELKRALNFNVTAGTTARVSVGAEVSDFKYVVASARVDDGSTKFIIRIDWDVPEYTFGAVTANDNFTFQGFDSTGLVDVKTKRVRNIPIVNEDTEDHAYDVYLWGVR